MKFIPRRINKKMFDELSTKYKNDYNIELNDEKKLDLYNAYQKYNIEKEIDNFIKQIVQELLETSKTNKKEKENKKVKK